MRSALLVLAFLPACKPPSFIVRNEGCAIQASVTRTDSAGATTPVPLTDCMVKYDTDFGVITWDLIAPGTSGSFALPGEGWITLSFDTDHYEPAQYAVSRLGNQLPTSVEPQSVSLSFWPSGSMRLGGSGVLSLTQASVDPSASAAQLEASFAGVGLSDGSRLGGAASLSTRVGSGMDGPDSGYSGTGAADCARILAAYSWTCPAALTGPPGTPPDVNAICIRDTYVGAAVNQCWAAECYARLGQTEKAEAAGNAAIEELRKADALCSDVVSIDPATPCTTLQVWGC